MTKATPNPKPRPPARPKTPLRCLLGFHKRAQRKPCHGRYDPLRYCQYCRQPMEKAPDGEWRVKRS